MMNKEELMTTAMVIEGVALINATPHPLNIVQKESIMKKMNNMGFIVKMSNNKAKKRNYDIDTNKNKKRNTDK